MKFDKVERPMRNGQKIGTTLECVINGQVMHVPEDMNNAHYAELKKQESEGKIVIADRNLDNQN